MKYAKAMNRATHPSHGDDVKMAGGVASVVYKNDSGKQAPTQLNTMYVTFDRPLLRLFGGVLSL